MHQKHVIPHPDQRGSARSRQNHIYPSSLLLTSNLIQKIVQMFIHIDFKYYCEFIYFIIVYFGNFRGGKNRGSMDLVHDRGSMDPVHISLDPVHGGGQCFALSQCMMSDQNPHSGDIRHSQTPVGCMPDPHPPVRA